MKTILLSISVLLGAVATVFSQTATIQGNVQTNAAGDQSGIQVVITGTTYNGLTPVSINQTVNTDAQGNYSFTYNLYTNPLYPAFSNNQYADIMVKLTFNKSGYDSKEILNVTANVTPVTIENTLLFPTGIELYKPTIAMVRYDTLGQYPNVVWERALDKNIKTYIVNRLQGSQWVKAGEVPFTAHGIFEDTDADPSKQYEYQLQVIFEDDSKSDYSASKQSPKIEVVVENGVPRIHWSSLNEISRIDPLLIRKVLLYRSDSPQGVYEVVDELDISNLTQNELLTKLSMIDKTIPAAGTYYYRIGHEYYNWIDPRNHDLKIESGPFILAMSNISEAQNTETSISKINSEKGISITPSQSYIQIQSNTKSSYTITTSSGKIISQGTVKGSKAIQVSPGVYVVKCGTDSKTIIIQ